MAAEERIKRHENHFTKLFGEIDNIKDEVRNNYVRAPTFLIALISVVALMSGSVGSALTIVYQRTEKNQELIINETTKNNDSIVEIAVEQGKIQERQVQESERQNIYIAKLIETLKEVAKPKSAP